MIDQWQTDDLALCIKQGRWRDIETRESIDFGPRAGQILNVVRVHRRSTPHGEIVLLGFPEWSHECFAADRFVKIGHQPSERRAQATKKARRPVQATQPNETLHKRGDLQPSEGVAKQLDQIEELLAQKELGRLHPELGDVYDQIEPSVQRTLDSIMRTSLRQRWWHLREELSR